MRRLRRVLKHAAACACAAAPLFAPGPVTAAQAAAAELEALTAAAQRDGAAYVVATVARISLQEAGGGDPAKLAALRNSERALIAELGPQAWPFGRTNNQLGRLSFYVTTAGLQQMRSSSHALGFQGSTNPLVAGHRVLPEFRALEAASLGRTFIDAVVRVRNEAASFDITAQGTS